MLSDRVVPRVVVHGAFSRYMFILSFFAPLSLLVASILEPVGTFGR